MELSEAMRTTGTCRHYSEKPVPDEVLYDAFDVARFGPQGGNRQPVRWIVVRDEAKKKVLADLYLPYWEAYYSALSDGRAGSGGIPKTIRSADEFARNLASVPAIIVVCAEVSGLYPTDAELDRISVVAGASIYPIVQNLCLALRDQGVGSAVTTFLCHEEPAVSELLGIPEGFITAAHIAVGYPRDKFPTKLNRRRVEEIVSVDSFDTPLFA